MIAALLLLSVAAPDVHWSKEHEVGVWFPRTWKVVQRDKGPVAFAVKGPRLGKGIPRLVLQRAGPANAPLDKVAAGLLKPVLARKGWVKTARQRKTVGRDGAFPCVRVGFRFVADGGKGRARFTVALLGDSYWVLECSAHASHFPGATYDRIEKSLRARWKRHRLGMLEFAAPAGWKPPIGMGGIAGPSLGSAHAPTVLLSERKPLTVPPGAKPGDKWFFLKQDRVARTVKHEGTTLILVKRAPPAAALIIPKDIAVDVEPTLRAILKSVRVRRNPPDKDD